MMKKRMLISLSVVFVLAAFMAPAAMAAGGGGAGYGDDAGGAEAAGPAEASAAGGDGAGGAAKAKASVERPKVFVLGIDGMDPDLLRKFVDKGRMPNFKAFIEKNTFTPLGTSMPPQSPVAWANFITGMDPGGHGIFDFIHCDRDEYFPTFSASSVTPPEKTIQVGKYVIPLSGGEAANLRKGDAFWQIMDGRGIPYTIFRVPSNFPPVHCDGQSISGMGTPDLLGTYGTFSFYTDNPAFEGAEMSGGEAYMVTVDNLTVKSGLIGPVNSFLANQPSLTREFVVNIDNQSRTIRLKVEDHVLIIKEGAWTDWVPVTFDVLGPLKKVGGICRFYLKSIEPYFQLYVTPINIDPANPALPISTPPDYAKDIAGKIGRFYTQGMPEDTKGLEWGVLSDEEFVKQTQIVLEERFKMLDTVLDELKDGLTFFYVSTLDQSCHMLWRNMDPAHPNHPEDGRFKDTIENLYARMDDMLGIVQSRLPAGTTLIVMSDHGFAPFYRKVNLNAWLYQEGYMTLKRPDLIGQYPAFGNVFWRRTQAYSLGINGMYLNVRGREANGIVEPGHQFDQLLTEIEEKLLALRDPENGNPVVSKVYRTSEIYHGPYQKDAPDLEIGFHRGYRASDPNALGQLSEVVITDNMNKWSGDHCMAHELVPGVLLVNRPVKVPDPELTDLGVSILALYGIEKKPEMRGRVIFE